jgi:hypothetical protein
MAIMSGHHDTWVGKGRSNTRITLAVGQSYKDTISLDVENIEATTTNHFLGANSRSGEIPIRSGEPRNLPSEILST